MPAPWATASRCVQPAACHNQPVYELMGRRAKPPHLFSFNPHHPVCSPVPPFCWRCAVSGPGVDMGAKASLAGGSTLTPSPTLENIQAAYEDGELDAASELIQQACCVECSAGSPRIDGVSRLKNTHGRRLCNRFLHRHVTCVTRVVNQAWVSWCWLNSFFFLKVTFWPVSVIHLWCDVFDAVGLIYIFHVKLINILLVPYGKTDLHPHWFDQFPRKHAWIWFYY